MIDIIDAIKAINPNANVVVMEEDINQITWHNDTPVISNEDILAKQAELQIAEDALVEQKNTNKANAISKLEALGLNIDEIDALTQMYKQGAEHFKKK
ncbi:hypothetical protein [uncultured Mediterranean phage]|nr:hypothetical protein [uncultured Mediterranean phage]